VAAGGADGLRRGGGRGDRDDERGDDDRAGDGRGDGRGDDEHEHEHEREHGRADDDGRDDAGRGDDRGPDVADRREHDGSAGVGLRRPAAVRDLRGEAAGGPPSPARWTVTSPNCSGAGTLAVDDTRAHRGANSLRVDGGGSYCDHVFIANTEAIAAIGPQVFGRFWVRFEAALGQGHVTFATLRDSAAAVDVLPALQGGGVRPVEADDLALELVIEGAPGDEGDERRAAGRGASGAGG
jgi:hypothetical protein